MNNTRMSNLHPCIQLMSGDNKPIHLCTLPRFPPVQTIIPYEWTRPPICPYYLCAWYAAWNRLYVTRVALRGLLCTYCWLSCWVGHDIGYVSLLHSAICDLLLYKPWLSSQHTFRHYTGSLILAAPLPFYPASIIE